MRLDHRSFGSCATCPIFAGLCVGFCAVVNNQTGWLARARYLSRSLVTCTFSHTASSGFPLWLTSSRWLVATVPCGAASNNPTFHDEVSARMTDGAALLFPTPRCTHLRQWCQKGVWRNVGLWKMWAAWRSHGLLTAGISCGTSSQKYHYFTNRSIGIPGFT